MALEVNRVAIFTKDYLEKSRQGGLFEADAIPSLLSFVGIRDSIAVLDVGTGLGYWTGLMKTAAPACRFIGLDVREDLLTSARGTRDHGSNRTEFAVGDCYALPFMDGTFDLVTCLTLLMHVSRPLSVVREMRRVCRAGGHIAAIEGIPRCAPSNFFFAGEDPQVHQELARSMRAQIEISQPSDSDLEIALKLPRLLLDAGFEEVQARAYSIVRLDNGQAIAEHRMAARALLQQAARATTRLAQFELSRADKVLNDARFASAIGDVQVKTFLAVRGKCAKANEESCSC